MYNEAMHAKLQGENKTNEIHLLPNRLTSSRYFFILKLPSY